MNKGKHKENFDTKDLRNMGSSSLRTIRGIGSDRLSSVYSSMNEKNMCKITLMVITILVSVIYIAPKVKKITKVNTSLFLKETLPLIIIIGLNTFVFTNWKKL